MSSKTPEPQDGAVDHYLTRKARIEVGREAVVYHVEDHVWRLEQPDREPETLRGSVVEARHQLKMIGRRRMQELLAAPPGHDIGLYFSAERWREVRTDLRFIQIVRLMRVVNALTLAYPPLLGDLEDQSPRARRERFAAITFAAALLEEGLDTASSLGEHFRHLPQFREAFAPLWRRTRQTGFARTLAMVRNQLVFHQDETAVVRGLEHFPDGETLIATVPEAHGYMQGAVYFDLADDVALGALFGDAPTADAYLARIAEFLEQVTDLFNAFLGAAHRLIPTVLRELGAFPRSLERPVLPEDED